MCGVVVPEICRAHILQVWWRLSATPYVLPNCPPLRSINVEPAIPHEATIQVAEIMRRKASGHHIILYQGDISRARDLSQVAEAVHRLGAAYTLILMGSEVSDGYVSELRRVCPDLLYIASIPAPSHLTITALADIGVAIYGHDMLNAIFCAPNKIWEYSSKGVPMLCQSIPGLEYTVVSAGAGLSCDTTSVDAIAGTLPRLLKERSRYSDNAKQFYASSAYEKTLEAIVNKLFPASR
jgi:hypothetical protein